MQKPYRSYVQRRGRCSGCQFRAAAVAGFDRKRWPDRAGSCDTDNKLPVFRFDVAVLEGMGDAQY